MLSRNNGNHISTHEKSNDLEAQRLKEGIVELEAQNIEEEIARVSNMSQDIKDARQKEFVARINKLKKEHEAETKEKTKQDNIVQEETEIQNDTIHKEIKKTYNSEDDNVSGEQIDEIDKQSDKKVEEKNNGLFNIVKRIIQKKKEFGKPFDPDGPSSQIGVDPYSVIFVKNEKDLERWRLKRAKEVMKNGNMSTPIQIYKDGYVYEGHHRLQAAREIGMDVDIEVLPFKYNTEESKKGR